MIKRFSSWDEYHSSEEPFEEISGPSPGGVSHMGLEISRQTVHDWVCAGLLDYVAVSERGHLSAGMVTAGSIKRLLALINSGELKLGRGGRGQSGVLDKAFTVLSERHPGMYERPEKTGLFVKKVNTRNTGL